MDERYGTASKETLGGDHPVRALGDGGAKTVQASPTQYYYAAITFRDRLIERGVQPLQYIKTDEFVVRIDGHAPQIISQETWAGWIAHFCSGSAVGSVPRVTLCIIRPETQPCCDNPAENADGSQCESCGMAIVNQPAKEKPVLRGPMRISPPRKSGAPSGLTPVGTPSKTQSAPSPRTLDSMLSRTPFPAQPSATLPATLPAAPSDLMLTEFVTTSFKLTPENSVMRRRNRGTREISVPTPGHSPQMDFRRGLMPLVDLKRTTTQWTKVNAVALLRHYIRLLAAKTRSLARIISHCLLCLYSFLLAPPFVIHKDLKWTTSRLENRLVMFQWTMAFNLAIASLCATLLALTNLQNNPIAQSFVILSGIFSFFGLIYTAFLALHMGDSKEQFFSWFLKQENLVHTPGSMWNLTIMMFLPLTWLVWALVNLCLGGVSYAIAPLRKGQPVESDSEPFNAIQITVFLLVIVASALFAFMIHLEIRKYGLSLKPCRQEAVLEQDGGNTVESRSISLT
ncbi:hypothetical protein C8R45DRAFT_940887 [Mycena sanguinolenta]|nr:hypothetical protein C8R45DRAFT_940887 [Mycena sanguinolenta]